MKKLVALCLLSATAMAQEVPSFEYTWNEGDGQVVIAQADLEMFGQTIGRFEIDYTAGVITTDGTSQRLLDIPNHLGVWIYDNGIHGEWYNEADERRLFRARWGLITAGTTVNIVVTWSSQGYALIIDGVLRIHDWQTWPSSVFPDADIVSGVYGDPATTGTFNLRVYDDATPYDPCTVDVVGTINENVPDDNTGAWSQGIDPSCFSGSIDLSWTAPTHNEDGSTIVDSCQADANNCLAGYKIYESDTSGGPYTLALDLQDAAATSTTLANKAPGTYYFVATAYNVGNVESAYSGETSKTIDAPATTPLPPILLEE